MKCVCIKDIIMGEHGHGVFIKGLIYEKEDSNTSPVFVLDNTGIWYTVTDEEILNEHFLEIVEDKVYEDTKDELKRADNTYCPAGKINCSNLFIHSKLKHCR